jgi:hypothetical protein
MMIMSATGLLAGGVFAIVLGGGLLLFRRPLTRWNARGADAMKSEHIRQVTEPSDGYPGAIVGVSTLVLIGGVVLVVIGATQV